MRCAWATLAVGRHFGAYIRHTTTTVVSTLDRVVTHSVPTVADGRPSLLVAQPYALLLLAVVYSPLCLIPLVRGTQRRRRRGGGGFAGRWGVAGRCMQCMICGRGPILNLSRFPISPHLEYVLYVLTQCVLSMIRVCCTHAKPAKTRTNEKR